MNTLMFEHPLTAVHLTLLEEILGYTVIPPISKKLACGETGIGAMAEPKDIVSVLDRVMKESYRGQEPPGEDSQKRTN